MTNYFSKINANNTNYPIGGENFDGQWVHTNYSILSKVDLSGGKTFTYSLEDCLPDDNFVYEVVFTGSTTSNGSSGNWAGLIFYSGTSTAGEDYGWRLNRCIARTSAAVSAGGNAILPIYPNDRNITVRTLGSTTNKTVYLIALTYRRLGKND